MKWRPDPPDGMPDMGVAIEHLTAMLVGAPLVDMRWFVEPGAPQTKERPRSGRSGLFYTPRRTRTAERNLALRFLACRGVRPISGDVAIACVFFWPDRRRRDSDNALKLVLDAGTKGHAWLDDSQIVAAGAFCRIDKHNPRTVVAWTEVRQSRQ